MEPILLVCKPLHRDAFVNEEFTGQDDILMLVEQGSFVFDNGSGSQEVSELEAVNFKRGVAYRRHITQPAELYLFRYRSENDVFGSGKVHFRDRERVCSTLRLLHLCDGIVQADDFTYKRALFADLVTQYCLENAAELTQRSETDELICAAIAHINSHLHEKLNLAELAASHYLSYIQFFRRFKQATGATPQDYVAGLRLKKAQLLLTETELSVKQIARNCGFGNEYYFSNFFRNRCSITPSQYRTMIKTADMQPHN